MADRNHLDEEGYVVMVGTTFDGCKDPKGQRGQASSSSTDSDSWSSSCSSCSNQDESDENPNTAAGFQYGSATSVPAEDPLPAGYLRNDAYTYSPAIDPGRKRYKINAVAGIETPPSSPILGPIDGPDELDSINQRPRTDDDILELGTLEGLFPHMSGDQIKNLIPACKRYRDEVECASPDSQEVEYEIDDQQNASNGEY